MPSKKKGAAGAPPSRSARASSPARRIRSLTAGYTSADAAGLPILPGLVRADEVFGQGRIDHALRFTVHQTSDAYVFPAAHHTYLSGPADTVHLRVRGV